MASFYENVQWVVIKSYIPPEECKHSELGTQFIASDENDIEFRMIYSHHWDISPVVARKMVGKRTIWRRRYPTGVPMIKNNVVIWD